MGKVPKKPSKVSTPGSYNIKASKGNVPKGKASSVSKGKASNRSKGKATSGKSTPSKKKGKGRPTSAQKKKRERQKYRANYTEEDLLEAIRLVSEEGFSIASAANFVNTVKTNKVPRMTLADRLTHEDPDLRPVLGRPQQLSTEVEEAIVKCLELCSEFNYPLRKRDLQNLVQSYCVENSVKTRWEKDQPGQDWIRSFKSRWSHRVKVKKPRNIKRSRAKVSPADVTDFFDRIRPNLEGIPPSRIFNYDESNFQDDPGAEKAFFAGGCKYPETIRNHSKTSFSVMFCIRWV
jgi:hypothetical protein